MSRSLGPLLLKIVCPHLLVNDEHCINRFVSTDCATQATLTERPVLTDNNSTRQPGDKTIRIDHGAHNRIYIRPVPKTFNRALPHQNIFQIGLLDMVTQAEIFEMQSSGTGIQQKTTKLSPRNISLNTSSHATNHKR